jgi:hypothetical protein
MNVRKRFGRRIVGVMSLILIAGLALGGYRALCEGRVGAAVGSQVLLVGLLALGFLSVDQRCPYCDKRTLPIDPSASIAVCDYCGSSCERVGRKAWRANQTPSDDRVWARKFLPKLRRLRVELSPGEMMKPMSPVATDEVLL